jgi:hypothetical protein
MVEAIGTFFMTCNPAWIFMIFPLLFMSVAVSAWRTHRQQVKLEANPIHMDERQYIRFNRERFRK